MKQGKVMVEDTWYTIEVLKEITQIPKKNCSADYSFLLQKERKQRKIFQLLPTLLDKSDYDVSLLSWLSLNQILSIW